MSRNAVGCWPVAASVLWGALCTAPAVCQARQFQRLSPYVPDDLIVDHNFGYDVDATDDALIVAAPEYGLLPQAYIYERDAPGIWNLSSSLEFQATFPTGLISVDIHDKIAAIGTVGEAKLYTRDPDNGWIATDPIAFGDPDQTVEVELHEQTLLLSSRISNELTAELYRQADDDTWHAVTTLDFGESRELALGSGIVLVGGQIYEEDNAGEWTPTVDLSTLGIPSHDFHSHRVAIDGDRIVVGEQWDSDAVFVLERTTLGNWSVNELIPAQQECSSGASDDYRYGKSVAIQDDTVLVGQYCRSESDASVLVFQRGAEGQWFQTDSINHEELTMGQFPSVFASDLAFAGDEIVISAIDDTAFVNGEHLYDGAVYVVVPEPASGWWTLSILLPLLVRRRPRNARVSAPNKDVGSGTLMTALRAG